MIDFRIFDCDIDRGAMEAINNLDMDGIKCELLEFLHNIIESTFVLDNNNNFIINNKNIIIIYFKPGIMENSRATLYAIFDASNGKFLDWRETGDEGVICPEYNFNNLSKFNDNDQKICSDLGIGFKVKVNENNEKFIKPVNLKNENSRNIGLSPEEALNKYKMLN